MGHWKPPRTARSTAAGPDDPLVLRHLRPARLPTLPAGPPGRPGGYAAGQYLQPPALRAWTVSRVSGTSRACSGVRFRFGLLDDRLRDLPEQRAHGGGRRPVEHDA